MNERIQELAVKSGISYYSKESAYEGSSDGFRVIPSTRGLEKFAELIVLECMKVCVNNTVGDRHYNQARIDCQYDIGLHFGVER